MITIQGREALVYARALGVPLNKHADPVSDGCAVSVDDAEAIAAEDPSLIWLKLSSADLLAVDFTLYMRPEDRSRFSPAGFATRAAVSSLIEDSGIHSDAGLDDVLGAMARILGVKA